MAKIPIFDWVKDYVTHKANQYQAEQSIDQLANLTVKDKRFEARTGTTKDFDFTDDEQVLQWTKKNISSNVPFLRAGKGLSDRDRNDNLRAYAKILHFRENMRDAYFRTQTVYRHSLKDKCASPLQRKVMAESVTTVTNPDGTQQFVESGRIEYLFCPSCKKAVASGEVVTEKVEVLKKPQYAEYFNAWNRVTAEASLVVYGESFTPEDVDSKPVVFHNNMPNFGQNTPPAMGLGNAPGQQAAVQATQQQSNQGGGQP